MDKNPLEEETNNKILKRKFGIAVKEEEKCELQEKKVIPGEKKRSIRMHRQKQENCILNIQGFFFFFFFTSLVVGSSRTKQ